MQKYRLFSKKPTCQNKLDKRKKEGMSADVKHSQFNVKKL